MEISLVAINNAIFYCEVIRCNKIILNSFNSKRRWLIRNPISIEKLNITNCSDNNIFCFYESSWDIFFSNMESIYSWPFISLYTAS